MLEALLSLFGDILSFFADALLTACGHDYWRFVVSLFVTALLCLILWLQLDPGVFRTAVCWAAGVTGLAFGIRWQSRSDS